MIFKPIEALSIASLFLNLPMLIGGLFDFLSPPPEQPSYNTLTCGDRYAGATYLTREQIADLQAGQYLYWSDVGQPFCRIISNSPHEIYFFPTAFKSGLGVLIVSNSQAVIQSWDFSIEENSLAPEYVAPLEMGNYIAPSPLPAPEQYAAAPQEQTVDCIPYP